MKTKKFVAVIGRGGSGKSTIIKSLTGCVSGSYRGPVEDHKTHETIEVIASSPQEKDMSRAALEQKMKDVVTDPKCLGMVIALQPTFGTRTKRLSLEDVVEMAKKHIKSRHLFVIEQPYHGGNGIKPSDIEVTDANIKPLDARRFAYLNARLIRRELGWFSTTA